MNIRRITSMTMLVSFVLLSVTSIVLYIVPHGRVAYWADWHLWGLSKTQWDNLHLNLGLLFLIAGLLHIACNWKPILAYLRNRSGKVRIVSASFNIALLLCLAVAGGTLLDVPPMSTVIRLGEVIKEKAADRYGEPPYGHAELSPLKLFARRTGMDLDKAILLLHQAGIRLADSRQTIQEIAVTNSRTPRQIYDIIKPAIQKGPGTTSFPDTPPPGFGRRLLTEICQQYHLDLSRIMAGLLHQGLDVNPELSIRQIAAANDMDPQAFFEVLHQAATR